MMHTKDSIIIRIAGDSGDGVQLIGEELTITAALSGRDVRTLPDFPAEIRAPQGTIAGVSGFQLAMASNALFTAGEELDVLVALNPAALKKALPYLKPNGLLILNQDNMTDKDWAKVDGTPEMLDALTSQYQLLSIPMVSETVTALQHIELSTSDAKKAKNFYVLGVILWLFELETTHAIKFITHKFKHKPNIQKANQEAFKAGFNYAMTLELSRQNFEVGEAPRTPGEYRQVTGVDAVSLAIATLATGTKTPCLAAGYPITPASAILQACASLEDYGVALFQAEDEIAAIGAALGAAYGGALAITCTSGPGFDLKSETLGLAVVSELPLVVLDVQRAGASTGLPTKTGQSDLKQALYGRHGESPVPVIAPKSPSDCFDTIIEAFRIAVKYMTPVVVLMDAYLANAAEPWRIPSPDTINLPEIKYYTHQKPFARNEDLARSWNVPGHPDYMHHLGGLEKSGEAGQISYEPDNHQAMVHLRAEKIQKIANSYPELVVEGEKNADVVLVSWGSTYGSVRAVRKLFADENLPHMAHIHLKHLNPLPKALGTLLKQYQKVLVLELNTGQLVDILRAKYLIDARSIGVCTGQPFSITALKQAILQEMAHESA